MNISIFTYGSRGDVQPYLALTVGLQKAGHAVQLAAPHRFESLVTAHNISFVPLAGDPEVISKSINDAGQNALRVAKNIRDYVFSITADVSRASFAAAEGADLLVHSFLFTTGMHSWAREHHIPDISVQVFPVFAPTSAFPNVALSWLPPGAFSYFTHWLTDQIMWYGGNSGYKPALREHPEISYPKKLYWPFKGENPTPLLFACSPSVLPRPADWGGHVHVPGYFFLDDADYQPPESLSRFLAFGPAPICISFGSMINRNSERIHRIVTESILQTGNRAIILTGWGGWKPGFVSSDLFYTESVPHSWLLPRCKAIVHHGGAGTTAAGLRAGIPNIVIPHTADQPFWGRRVHALGAGPAPIFIENLTSARFSSALVAADNSAVINASRAIGESICAEDGISSAIHILEQRYHRFP